MDLYPSAKLPYWDLYFVYSIVVHRQCPEFGVACAYINPRSNFARDEKVAAQVLALWFGYLSICTSFTTLISVEIPREVEISPSK